MKPLASLFKRSASLLAVVLPFAASALVSTREQGTWPANWPKELEPFRSRARTIEVATGIQQNIYEIRFESREEFERVWPVILKLKTPGAPVTLYTTNNPPPKAWGNLLRNDKPVVRIYAPSEGHAGGPSSGEAHTPEAVKARIKEGKMLHAGSPWPANIVSTNGALPEFVVAREVDGKLRWVLADIEKDKKENKRTGFYNRARVDLELVIDGQFIDLTKIHFTRGTLVHDERFPIPDLTAKQRADLITEGHQAYRQLVQKQNVQGNAIPREFWGPTIVSLKPLRVMNDRANIKIVIAEHGGIEGGFYVILPISSFAPGEEYFLEFVRISQPEESTLGLLYRYKLAR